jgi:hypothetical protein
VETRIARNLQKIEEMYGNVALLHFVASAFDSWQTQVPLVDSSWFCNVLKLNLENYTYRKIKKIEKDTAFDPNQENCVMITLQPWNFLDIFFVRLA